MIDLDNFSFRGTICYRINRKHSFIGKVDFNKDIPWFSYPDKHVSQYGDVLTYAVPIELSNRYEKTKYYDLFDNLEKLPYFKPIGMKDCNGLYVAKGCIIQMDNAGNIDILFMITMTKEAVVYHLSPEPIRDEKLYPHFSFYVSKKFSESDDKGIKKIYSKLKKEILIPFSDKVKIIQSPYMQNMVTQSFANFNDDMKYEEIIKAKSQLLDYIRPSNTTKPLFYG